ncbi:hypothetical protein TNIN_303861 [Trichonephila inaurata madagascariensis]|uniref:Uncharacterized protein n=1 Tax=Trichonephila inaurata madagascariensis TaxID=2747483 RepID=A0A8X7CNP2_9ARAC|nr:hypothetical protein TNIN_303861 [Trichonephila inaurata madagascariensis]
MAPSSVDEPKHSGSVQVQKQRSCRVHALVDSRYGNYRYQKDLVPGILAGRSSIYLSGSSGKRSLVCSTGLANGGQVNVVHQQASFYVLLREVLVEDVLSFHRVLDMLGEPRVKQ